MLNRTTAPVRAFRSDDKRIGKYHPIFSTGLFGSYFRFSPEPGCGSGCEGGQRFR